jgi:prepilin-type N-terminal cleavage/methylation domain-containing protein
MINGPRGYTLVEMVLGIAIAAIVAAISASAIHNLLKFNRKVTLQNEMNSDAMIAVRTLTDIIAIGRSTTVTITSPATTPLVPNSQIDFELATPLSEGTTAYTFALVNGTLQMTTYVTGGITRNREVAKNVQSLTFGYADTTDLTHLSFSLIFSAAPDPKTQTKHAIYNQIVTMLSS